MPTYARDKVFISYSHSDHEWLHRLERMLRPLVRTKAIVIWHDKKIDVGAKWREEISKALATAKVAVLLVSPNFLASDFIAENELPPILEAASCDGLHVIWIALSHCLWETTGIGDYQAINDPSQPLDSLNPSEQNRALKRVCENIQRLMGELESERPTLQSSDRRLQRFNRRISRKQLLWLLFILITTISAGTYFYLRRSSISVGEKLARIWDRASGMPQLNREFNYWIKADLRDQKGAELAFDKLQETAGKHAPLISDMKDCEKALSECEGPYQVIVLYNYMTMAYYQLAAVSRYDAAFNPAAASVYDKEAIDYASRCVEYADKGFDWNRRVMELDLDAKTRQWWSQQTIESDRNRLQHPIDRIDRDLQWYKTAGRAILSYYDLVPFGEAYAEVKDLKTKFPFQDPPEDDPTMRWVLTSNNGVRPPGKTD